MLSIGAGFLLGPTDLAYLTMQSILNILKYEVIFIICTFRDFTHAGCWGLASARMALFFKPEAGAGLAATSPGRRSGEVSQNSLDLSE
jgi:hypothetical protein